MTRTPALRTRPALVLGVAVLAATVLTGCSGTSTNGASSAPSTSAASATTPAASESPSTPTPSPSETGRTLAVSVTGSTVKPAPATVDLPVGQTLTLTVTSDHADEVHAHGFEVEKEVAAGGTATLVLTAKDPGVYEVEMHHPALLLLKIAVS